MKNNILYAGINKIIYAMITQFFIVVCSLVIGFVLPKYMGSEQYGYWQIYYFYLNYINLATFGFNDGIALRYGGYDEDKLPLSKIRSAIWILSQALLILTIFIIIGTGIVDLSSERRFIYITLAISLPFVCMMNIIVTIFLSVNRQAIYNRVNLVNKLISSIAYLILILIGIKSFQSIIMSDIVIRLILTLICVYIGRKFIFGLKDRFTEGFTEVKQNISAGKFITVGALASAFIPMAGRVVLEHNESIQTYGIYSFAMSLLGIIVTFASTAGMVFFPIMKRISIDNLPLYYTKLKEINNLILYISLLAYIPITMIINQYLTDYQPVLSYAFILFVMCIPLGKMQTLITVYYKIFRMERQYFLANISGALIMLISTYIAYYCFGNVFAVATTTTIIFTLWSDVLELYLMKRMNLKLDKSVLEELMIMLAFLAAASTKNLIILSIGYTMVLLIVIVSKYHKIKDIYTKFRNEVN